METKKIGILGYGEIGKAIASFYKDPAIHDPALGHSFEEGLTLDILHVCIPYKTRAEFEIAVKFAVERHCRYGLVIIHSTVAVGTTRDLGKLLEHKLIVHSPVRGVHPNIAEGIKTFPKFIGADFAGAGRAAAEHFEELGIPYLVVYKSKASELMKLLDTTYYGLAIAFHSFANDLCINEDVSFDMVMREANRTYNEGYMKLGKPNVVRPVLYPPENRRIGGHCVVPNAQILKDQYGTDAILEAILRHK